MMGRETDMVVTEVQQLLIDAMKAHGVSTGKGAAIFMTLQTEANMMDMCGYILSHKGATEDELLDKAREIAGAFQAT